MEKLKVGIAGLGRLGKTHGENLAFKIPNARLTAACSLADAELDYAKTQLGVGEVYKDYREMVDKADIEAVAIVTTSSEHCWQIAYALDAGKHVFTDKPLGTTLEECLMAERAVEAHPDKVFFLGFMRRYDPSYAYAKEKIRQGAIGVPYLVKATGLDPEALVEGVYKFLKTSGGIYIDMAVHDIDLMRWFLDSDPVEVYALGCNFKHVKEFTEAGDSETGCAMYRFANGAIGQLHVGRTAPHGYHVETEIVGTEGTIRISPVPEKNLTVFYNTHGVVTDCVQTFPERFAQAYLQEMQAFVDCVQQGTKPGVQVYDGTRCTEIAFATTEAYQTGRLTPINYSASAGAGPNRSVR